MHSVLPQGQAWTLPPVDPRAYTRAMSLPRLLPAGVLVVLGALLGPTFVVAAGHGHKEKNTREEQGKPRLRLVADPSVGFTPISVVLTGQLSGVDLNDANFCHAAVTWIRIDPGQTEREGLRVREDPACVHPKEQVFVATSFTKSYTLYTPGSYLFRLEVEGKDHARIDSAYVKVEVLRVQ